jgi:hypothetical protein
MTELRADCARCAALCCVALPFSRSADFAFDKPAGVPCVHLGAGFACRIHDRLPGSGFPGCAAYDCFGAGQRVVRQTFTGRDWRTDPDVAEPMFAAFTLVQELHELLWYLDDALSRVGSMPLATELRAAWVETDRLAADVLAEPDIAAHRAEVVAPLLHQVSVDVRGVDAPDRSGADLAGRDLRLVDLRRTRLRGALLLGADLRGADLRDADLLGADLRGADLRGADVTDALYVTRLQVGSARGDATTRLPPRVEHPAHWLPRESSARTTGTGRD